MSELQQFGGDWTIEKLDILTSYLDAYLTALKNMRFGKIYVDAFAGTGTITTRDGSRQVSGSARLSLLAQNHFDQYYFILVFLDKVVLVKVILRQQRQPC